MTSTLIIVDPDIQSGAPVFAGTRVPVQNLFDYLEEGNSLDVFLTQFPSVTREQAVAGLVWPGVRYWPTHTPYACGDGLKPNCVMRSSYTP